MPLLTIFTAPKPFTDPHIATIQRNALRSWVVLGADVEVMVVGDEAGMGPTAAEMGLRHLPDVAVNEYGTPLVNSIFDLARHTSNSPIMVYVNADILLLPDIVTAARLVQGQVEKYLIVGRRWDLDVTENLDFSPGWEENLRLEVTQRGRLHAPAGSDYFIFPRGLFTDMPPFAIGRAGWDNWMIYQARQQRWPVIDASREVTIVHQNHDYSHLPGGQIHHKQEETHRNAMLGGGYAKMYLVLDTDKELVAGVVHPARLTPARFLRRLEIWLVPTDDHQSGPRWWLARRLRALRRRVS